MMTLQNVGVMLELLESNYGQKFYDGVNKDSVIKTWATMFKDDDPQLVMLGVKKCINTMPYKPTIGDIRQQMSSIQMQGQMTEMEVFQAIKQAIRKADDRENATKAFNELPTICRKIVVNSSQLRDWRYVPEESFETVVASMISRSYRVVAEREVSYYSMPKDLQKLQEHLVSAPEKEALPEPKKEPTIDDMWAEMERKEKEYREKHRPERTPERQNRINALLEKWNTEPIEDVQRRVDLREQRKFDLLSKQ